MRSDTNSTTPESMMKPDKAALRAFCAAAQAVGLLDLNEALVAASKKGQAERVQALIDGGADAHFKMGSALWHAVEHDHIETAKVLLANGANINCEEREDYYEGEPRNGGISPLFAAIKFGSFEAVKFLVENGADVKVLDSLPLMCAVHLRRPDVIKLLLDNGADVHAKNDRTARMIQGKDGLDIPRVQPPTEKDCEDTERILRSAGAKFPTPRM